MFMKNLFLPLCAFFLFLGILCAQAQAQDPLPYYKVTQPSGKYKGKRPVGWVMVIHGGAWVGAGSGAGDVAKTAAVAKRYNNRGWAVVNTDYRAGGANGFTDVSNVFDGLRRSLPRKTPICLYGESAGAHFAQLLAGFKGKQVACLVSVAGPADFVHYDNGTSEAEFTLNVFQYYFGNTLQDARMWSPVTYANRIASPVLLSGLSNDVLVPKHQLYDMDKALRGDAQRVSIAPQSQEKGGKIFVHGYAQSASLNKFYSKERSFMVNAVKGWAKYGKPSAAAASLSRKIK